MDSPNPDHSWSTRSGPRGTRTSPVASEHQYSSECPIKATIDPRSAATTTPDLPLRSLQRVSTYTDNNPSPSMSLQFDEGRSSLPVGYGNEKTPSRGTQGGPFALGAIGPDDAPRMRSSTFGIQYADTENAEHAAGTSQQPLFAQHSGPASVHGGTTQAGPSYSRYTSPVQPPIQSPPISSIIHTAEQNQVASSTAGRPSTSTRSPFTPPIACPPRNRPNQILLVNPTSTPVLTNLMLNTLRPILPHSVEVTAYNAPYPAPTAIESVVDSVLSSETVLRDLAKYTTNNGETVQNYDGLLIASYSKHPLIDALRETYDVPVIGILEASLYVARMLGARFGIVTTSTRVKFQVDDAVAGYGLSHFCVGVESLHINPLDLANPSFTASTNNTTTNPATATTTSASTNTNTNTQYDKTSQSSTPFSTPRSGDELTKRLTIQSRTLVSKGADTIILGSEFLASNEAIRTVKDAVRDEDGRRTVNVVDSVEAGIMMLNGLIGMGIPTSKKGLFRGEREGRRGRGQNWL